ncbi:carboxyltransferase domain-containing protein [Roseovarius autotrophicus]|uniref:carboxyltransferase domain-containing protein n=1 Tax=Roseovarius autotrophicus TaxID=2824121 RepID=UPI0019F957D2|nr:allophanate hydrolase subunit 1 [Roseovarius sp.]
MTDRSSQGAFPRLGRVGLDGLLVSFGDRLSEAGNRAALAFRAAVERASPEGVEETSTSLVSTFLRIDALRTDPDAVASALQTLLDSRDWYAEPLPEGRRLWRIPTVYGTDLAPQLDEAASEAGLSPEAAASEISSTRVRVQTIGFAPGQPYLGELPAHWDIPRQQALTDRVPVGALVVAIRQLVLFSVSTPTGWRHIGQTPFRLFRPESETPFVLRPGDEVVFEAVERGAYERLSESGPDGGATCEAIR